MILGMYFFFPIIIRVWMKEKKTLIEQIQCIGGMHKRVRSDSFLTS